MKLLKFKAPNKSSKKSGGGGIDYLKWKFDVNISNIIRQLEGILLQFKNYDLDFSNLPIEIHFNRLLPKSSRIKNIFKCNGQKPNQIGSKYVFDKQLLKDEIILTYSCTHKDIEETLNILKEINDKWPVKLVEFIEMKRKLANNNSLLKRNDENHINDFKNVVKEDISKFIKDNNYKFFEKYYSDIFEIRSVKITHNDKFSVGQIVSFFELDSFQEILEKLRENNIEISPEVISIDQFLNLDVITLNKVIEKFPFLISKADVNMGVETLQVTGKINNDPVVIKSGLEINGTVGVIDTYASFKNGWENYVDYTEIPLPIIEGEIFEKDYSHGTSVASIIVGNDVLNQKFNDDLGIFKVKLFGVLPSGRINMFYFMKKIEQIIEENYKEIKIWNLSIDSENDAVGISLLGQFFDIIQKKYDVLFVIAAGNTANTIGAGADSLSALTVGSLYPTSNNQLEIASYSGSKKIFGRFSKPNTYEVSNEINALNSSLDFKYCLDDSGYVTWENGTSFSAPMTARKCCYLLNKYNLSLEAIKAIINLTSEISEVKIPNINFDNSTDKLLIVVEGEAIPKDLKSIDIKLPVNKKDNSTKDKYLQDFTYALGVSYSVVPSNKLGDEYSSVELEVKIVNQTTPTNTEDIFKAKKTPLISGTNANEKTLLDHFKKYDPNKVLVNKDFDKPWGYTLETEQFFIKMKCTDLFDELNEPIKYACVIILKEKNFESLKNFELLNEQNIILDEVFITEQIEA